MPIENMRLRHVSMARTDPEWRTATYAASRVEACIVEIVADGLVGVGGLAGRPPGRGAQARELMAQLEETAKPLLVGADPLERHALLRQIQDAGVHRSALAAVDMALYDLLGKRTGLPLATLWGGTTRQRLPIIRMIGIKSPPALVAAAGELIEAGFTHFKVKLGTGVYEDVARIRALREAYGDAVWIAIDGNGAYSSDEAIALSRGLEPYTVRLIEQPIAYEDLDGLARVTAASPIPILADQYVSSFETALAVCQRKAAHMVSVKIGQAGTIDECRTIAELCLGFGIRVHVGGSARPVVVDAAHAQLVAGISGIEPECEIGECLALTGDITGGVTIRDGSWELGSAPGLGVTVLG